MTDLAQRLLQRDTTLWPEGNVAPNRLGWIAIADYLQDHATSVLHWASAVRASHIVLIGMGGSSLGPEVLRSAIGSDRLIVLDTTDPATVESIDTENTFFLVSSKSGGTLEVRSLLSHFWQLCPKGESWAAITDPGTELESLAKERGFSKVFLNPPDIGGRFSVLSFFGMVPAALLGYDVDEMCAAAKKVDVEEAVELGIAIAESAKAGRDKLTVMVQPGSQSLFGLWLEQLVAESTGKNGVGVVPVPTTEPEAGKDRHFERVTFSSGGELAAEFYRWEIATAIAGHILEIDPFNEPNVTESKENTKRVLAAMTGADAHSFTPPPTAEPVGTLEWLKNTVKPGDYVSLQAYLPYKYDYELEILRRHVRDELGGIAVTAGFGPRFLHSTGQLHKGGKNNIVAVQLVPKEPTAQVPVPGEAYDFATLINAQSIGDYESLVTHHRRVRRVACTSPSDIR